MWKCEVDDLAFQDNRMICNRPATTTEEKNTTTDHLNAIIRYHDEFMDLISTSQLVII